MDVISVQQSVRAFVTFSQRQIFHTFIKLNTEFIYKYLLKKQHFHENRLSGNYTLLQDEQEFTAYRKENSLSYFEFRKNNYTEILALMAYNKLCPYL